MRLWMYGDVVDRDLGGLGSQSRGNHVVDPLHVYGVDGGRVVAHIERENS